MPEIIKTGDGSTTLYIKELDETYHSRHGAIQESMHVFIDNGLCYILSHTQSNTISILEIGFGTGLNALLSLEESKKYLQHQFIYHSLEAFPLNLKLIEELNYRENKEDLLKLHNCSWNAEQAILKNFNLCKYHIAVQEFNTDLKFDIIYYDAFGSRAQPEMWTESNLLKVASFLKLNGILVTYCAKGEVKRIFKNAGFKVETLKGPPGKKEMIRVVKIN